MTITHDMDENSKNILETLAGYNSYEYNLRKCAEEASELSTIILQSLNKPGFIPDNKIIEEIGDLDLRLKILKIMFGKDKVNERKSNKLKSWQKQLENKRYKEI